MSDSYLERPYQDAAEVAWAHEDFQESDAYALAFSDWRAEQGEPVKAYALDRAFQRTPEYADAFEEWRWGP